MRIALLCLVLVAGAACTTSSGGSGGEGPGGSSGSGGFGGSSGSAGEPNPPLLDGSAGDPSDAGDTMDGAVTEQEPNFTLECSGAEPSVPDDVLATWQAERDEQATIGYATTLALRGTTYRVHGATAPAAIEAPLAFRMNESGLNLISFDDAQVESIEETGRIEMFTDDSERGVARASSGSLEDVLLSTVNVEGGVATAALQLEDENISGTHFHHLSAGVRDLTFEAVETVNVYPEGSDGVEDRIAWMPDGPATIRTASRLTFYDSPEAALEQSLAAPMTLEYEAFSLAGDFTNGELSADGLEVRGTPIAVFGSSAELELAQGGIESSGAFQMTQAVNEAGLVIPAAVEVVPAEREIWVAPNGERVVQLHYRERSFRGDAALGEIEIGGSASDLLELKTGFRLALTEQIIEAVIDTGWAAPLAALATLPTVSIVFVIDIFSCFFGGCDTGPDLEPFPIWMQAGEIGTMEVLVKGGLPTGSYEASLTFVGRNYCPVTVPLTIHIGEPPTDGGSDGGEDASLADAQ